MTPTRYELLIEDGQILLRGICPELLKGHFNVEVVPFCAGESLPRLRQHGQGRAKHFNVPFIDKTKVAFRLGPARSAL
jgi:hypothetical protein